MAASTAEIANDAAIDLSLAGNTVGRESSEDDRRRFRRTLSQLLAGAMRLPRRIVLLSLGVNLLTLAPPFLLLVVFDLAAGGGADTALAALIAGLLVAIIAETVLRLARSRLFGSIAAREIYELEMRVARRMLNASYSATLRLSPSIAAESIRAGDEVGRFHGASARLTILDAPFIAIYLVAIGVIGGFIVIIPIILVLLFALWTARSREAMKPVEQEVMNRQQDRLDFYTQGIDSITTVKALAVEPHLQRRLESMLGSAAPSNEAYILRKHRIASAGQLFEALAFISVIAAGGMMAASGTISIGAAAACSLFALLVARSSRRVLESWEQAEVAQVALERSEALMDFPERRSGESDLAAPAKVQLNGVAMNYEGRPEKARGVNLTIRPGEIIGLVIRDDAQRQAMTDILRGRTIPEFGDYLIDGRTISADRDARLESVMFAGGEPPIFRGTIVENISMFGSVNPVTAIEMARRLDVEALIRKLPEGYRTRLDQDSAARFPRDMLVAITLVRAAAVRPRLLILDVPRAIPSDIATRTCEKLIEELRGSTTIIMLGRTLIETIHEGRNYRMKDWSLEPVDPASDEEDDDFEEWESAGDV